MESKAENVLRYAWVPVTLLATITVALMGRPSESIKPYFVIIMGCVSTLTILAIIYVAQLNTKEKELRAFLNRDIKEFSNLVQNYLQDPTEDKHELCSAECRRILQAFSPRPPKWVLKLLRLNIRSAASATDYKLYVSVGKNGISKYIDMSTRLGGNMEFTTFQKASPYMQMLIYEKIDKSYNELSEILEPL